MFSFLKKDSPPYSVTRIQRGELLDKATLATVHTFFNDWLNKRPRKAMVGSWFLLHEDETFVYWGAPVFQRLFSNERMVDDFYKTEKKELAVKFPEWKKQYNDFVWQRIYTIIKKEAKSISVNKNKPLKGSIKDNQFHIKVSCTLVHAQENDVDPLNSTKVTYSLVLDNKTLDLITINTLL